MGGVVGYLKNRLGRGAGQLPYLSRTVGIVWRSAPRLTVGWVALLAAQGVLPVALVYLTKALVDSLVAVTRHGGGPASLRAPLTLALAMGGLLLLGELLRAAARWVRTAHSEVIRDHVSGLVHDKALALDLAYFESPEYHDQLHRIRYDVQHRPMALMDSLGAVLQNTLTLVAMLVVVARFGAAIPVLLLVSTVPALWVVLRYAHREHEWRLRVTPEERRAYYYEWVLTSRENAAEVRLFGLGAEFRRLYQELRTKLRGERLRLARDEGSSGLVGGAAALAVTAAALAWMVWRAAHGEVTLGELAMFYQAFSEGQRLTRSLLESVAQIYTNSLFLGTLFEFLALQPRVVERPGAARPVPPLREGVRFRGVAFAYPGSERPVLHGFDLELEAGRVAAVVGANGAGKSTLIKLLCRLYDPQEGRIEFDGTDVRELPLQELRRMISVLFQEPVHYNMTFGENVGLADLRAAAERTRLRAASVAAGADEIAQHLPAGYETALGTWFAGGTELSVGEWQRVALARSFFRQAPLILLDEPTSAMDSWAENDWMARFRRLASGRTALVITHRFTTAMRADVIHVMSGGRIVESGTHAELVARGGLYATSWLAQMRTPEAGSPTS